MFMIRTSALPYMYNGITVSKLHVARGVPWPIQDEIFMLKPLQHFSRVTLCGYVRLDWHWAPRLSTSRLYSCHSYYGGVQAVHFSSGAAAQSEPPPTLFACHVLGLASGLAAAGSFRSREPFS